MSGAEIKINTTMNKELKTELETCDTLTEMLAICNKYYNLNFKLGGIAKKIIISKLPHLLKVIGAKKR